MRVGFLIDRWDPQKGGLEVALAALVTHLAERGDAPMVFGLSTAVDAPGEFVAVRVSTSRRGAMERELAAGFLRSAERTACDVTVALRHAPRADVYWPHGGLHAATLRAGELARSPLVRPLARLLHAWSPRHRTFRALEHEALTGGAARIWCVSRLVRDEIVAAYPGSAARVEVHANGVDRARFSPELRSLHRAALLSEMDVPPDAPVLLFAGTNWRLKGWPDAVAALSALKHLPWTCVLAGRRPEEAAHHARQHGLPGRVVVSPTNDMQRLLGAADVFVQPTHRDPCSLATLESLAAGVPVVTTSADGAAEALASSGAGSVIASGDVPALQRALGEWLAIASDQPRSESARAAARAATAGRDRTAWLDGLCASLEDVAGSATSTSRLR